jgi:hypothetical protein
MKKLEALQRAICGLERRDRPVGDGAVIRIAITAAYEAIAATLPLSAIRQRADRSSCSCPTRKAGYLKQ